MRTQSGSGDSPSQWKDRSTTSTNSGTRSQSDLDIAVIGMACKFPGANSLDEFWDNLEAGDVQCRDLPIDRFPEWRFDRRRGVKAFKGNMISDIDAFDHKFFKVASHEAKYMDPQQRLALQVVYQALESAGYFAANSSDREQDMGCYFATSATEYHEENVESNNLSAFSLTGSIRPFIAGKVSHHFGWTGPSVMFDTACSGSATAIHHACRAIAFGDCATAVAGATNLFISPGAFQELAAGHFISSTGPSKSFDAAADGYCRGEGIAFVVLKKLSTALEDGDLIRGVIASTAVGQNANGTAITIPHGPSQMILYRKALRLAHLDAHDISYVEGHGTGTPVGDPIELESIRGVFGDMSQSHHRPKTYLGSVKSNIGHTEATSGVAALIKVLLMLQKETIPRQAMFKNLNPAVAPLEPLNIEIPTQSVPWTASCKHACVNNYGASGSNAVMIVTESQCATPSMHLSEVRTYPISISAFSPSSLASYCCVLLDFINRSLREDSYRDVAYHLSRRQNMSLAYSVCGTVSSLQEIKEVLTSTIARQSLDKRVQQRPLVFFFSGQTGNSAGISRNVYDSFAVFRKHLDDCDAVLHELGALSIFPAAFETEPQDDVVVSHSLLFSVQYASAMAWLDCGLQPARLVGHSFGQLTALCVSGVLSLHDALQLIITRANLIKSLWGQDRGSMIAIEADLGRVIQLLSDHPELGLEVACHNGPQSFVLAGHTSAIEALQRILETSSKHLRWKRLNITHAFHSVLTEPLVKPLRDAVQSMSLCEAEIPLETCTNDHTWPSISPDLIAAHIREPVYFHQAVGRISEQLGPCTWLEAGSASSAAMLRRALGTPSSPHDIHSVKLDSVSAPELLATVTSDLWKQGIKVQFWPFHKAHKHQYKILNLPPYQFDKARHWLDYVERNTSPPEVQPQSQQEVSLLRSVQTDQNAGEFRVNTRHKTWQTSCLEYRMLGMPICPTSLLLDLVTQAITTMSGTPLQKAHGYHIRDWTMQSVIDASSENELKLTITRCCSPSSWEFMVHDATNAEMRYASGIISTSNEHAGKDFERFERLVSMTSIRQVSDDVEADSVRGRAVYRLLSDFSQIPKSRHTINQISIKANEAVGYLQSSALSPYIDLDDFIRVPLLCLNGLHDRRVDQIHMLAAVGEVRYTSPPLLMSSKDNAWVVYVKFFGFGDPKTTCDVFVFDVSNGRLFATILDLSFRSIEKQSLQERSGAPVSITPQAASYHQSSSEDPVRSQLSAITRVDPNSHNDIDESVQTAELPDLIENMFDLLVRMADVERDSLSTDVAAADLGIDSLMAMEIAEEINTFFSVNFSVEELTLAPNVGALCEIVAGQTTGFSYNPQRGSKVPPDHSIMSQSSTGMSAPITYGTKFSQENRDFVVVNRPISPPLSTDESRDLVLEAFESIRGQFDDFASVNGCDNFLSEVYPLQAELVVAYVVEAYAKLGCDLSSVLADATIPNIPHVPRYGKLVARLMDALCDDGLIRRDANGWTRTSKIAPPPHKKTSAEKLERLVAEFPDYANENKLLDIVGSKLDECLAGKTNPVALLFGSAEKRKMMTDQYTTAPMQRSAVQQVAAFIKQCFCFRTTRRTLRVLEIGGGTCATTTEAVKTLAQLKIPVEYTFSDISPSFVTAAKSKLREYEFVKFRALDIMAEPDADLLDSFDMIIATNVIHATPNACTSARNCRRMLRAGGFIVLTEYTEPLYTGDLVFGQLDGWWLFEDGRDHAMMDHDAWNMTLKRAGFRNVDWTGGKTKESQILRIFLAN